MRPRLRLLIAGLALAVAAAAAPGMAGAATANGAIVSSDYDLGVRVFPQPDLSGELASMPIRLWGTIAAPVRGGPHPVVVIAHGAHGDNCPGELGDWPCWEREQRNDLGFRYLAVALARAGFVAIAPDVNAAYTGVWGEPADRESARFGQVLTATVAELGRASRGLSTAFGIPLQGKANIARLGLIGHSRGGTNALGWAAGKRHVRSILLLAPAYDPARSIPDVLATVVVGTCDGNTGRQGAKYFAALRSQKRTRPAYKITLRPANHNFYNETLVALGADDAPADRPGCESRLIGLKQQTWLARVAPEHFAVSLLGAKPASWMRGRTTWVHGRGATVTRLLP